MRCRGAGCCVNLTIVLLAVALPGCHRAPASQQSASGSEAGRQFARGERVTLVKEVGDFALVKSGNGRESYVALGLLKHRNTATADQDHSFTHTIVRDTPTYSDPPAEIPVAPKPLSLEEIDLEQRTLNGLFLSEKSGKEVIAPRNVAQFLVDEKSGERCWHAYECTNPACPGERTRGRARYVFVHTEVNVEQAILCPACAELRKSGPEAGQPLEHWRAYVRPYELPETLRRRAELDAERRRAIEALRGAAAP